DIYVDSADGIAIMKNDEGKIILRAILWTLRNVKGDEQKFMDRIYSGNTAYETKIKSWAIQNGYAYLDSQTHSKKYAMLPNGSKLQLADWFVQTKKSHYETFPYLDTLSTFVGGMLFCRQQPVLELKATGGGYSTLYGDR
ncbi:MAG: hypothetical protein ACRCX2_13300, partial [Paraclostridium sp.]